MSAGRLAAYNCSFINNTASTTASSKTAYGGAVYATSSATVILYNTTFDGNKATATSGAGSGGALALSSLSTSVLLKNCVFKSNVASGAALSSMPTYGESW